MEQLQFDSGVRTYRVNGGETLCFNPADPNLYARFQEVEEKLRGLSQTFDGEGGDMLTLLQMTDRELKALLCWVFPGNDFEKIFTGVNLLAVTQTGKTVLENFLDALTPILCEGAECFAQGVAERAEVTACSRREAQC